MFKETIMFLSKKIKSKTEVKSHHRENKAAHVLVLDFRTLHFYSISSSKEISVIVQEIEKQNIFIGRSIFGIPMNESDIFCELSYHFYINYYLISIN